MQLHVDFTVSSLAELQRQRERAEALGAELLLDRTDDADEPLYVFADLSGHPFCIFVA
jgi:Glyoxalase-like domain